MPALAYGVRPAGPRRFPLPNGLWDAVPMIALEAHAVFWLLIAVQAAGLTSTWLTRLSEGSRCQTSCQRLFFGCLGLVGLATIASLGLGPGSWLSCGTTLSLMVVGVTWDVGQSSRAAIW